ncbi:MAG: hypothetical protein ACHQCH_02210 [Solirubrobacterales bacterium]|jgi:hypothetical protein
MWHDLAGEEQTRRGASARLRAEASTLMMVIETEQLTVPYLTAMIQPENIRSVRLPSAST